jgi:hypothetical protein
MYQITATAKIIDSLPAGSRLQVEVGIGKGIARQSTDLVMIAANGTKTRFEIKRVGDWYTPTDGNLKWSKQLERHSAIKTNDGSDFQYIVPGANHANNLNGLLRGSQGWEAFTEAFGGDQLDKTVTDAVGNTVLKYFMIVPD